MVAILDVFLQFSNSSFNVTTILDAILISQTE